MQMQWNREDIVSSDDEFSEMAAAVARFAQTADSSLQSEAAAKVTAVRSKEHGNLAVKLDYLYHCIYTGNVFFINEALDEVINEKRYRKSTQNASSRN